MEHAIPWPLLQRARPVSPARPDAGSSDEALMRAWQRGDELAFERLVSRYADMLFGFLIRTTVSRQQAEDAYSETLIRLLRYRDRFDPEERFRPWIFTIARNCALDLQRRGGRYVAMLKRAAEGRPASSRQADPHERLEGVARAERVDQALAQLPEEHRAAVLLAYRHDLDGPEIAAVLGITHRQVRDRLSYARRRMRAILQAEE